MSWMDGPFQTIYFPCEHVFNNDGFQLAPQQCPVCAEEAEDADPMRSWKREEKR